MAKHITAREKRKARIRKKLSGTTERPRLTVFQSLKHIYAQIVDDTTGQDPRRRLDGRRRSRTR